MADLNDRGQLILIAAFALAVTFVAISLVINSAIFTENLATRGETTGGSDTLLLRHEVEQSVENISEYVNRDNSTTPISAVENSTANLSVQNSVQNARRGRVVSVDVVDDSGEFHARVFQSNDSRAYTNASDDVDWELTDDAEQLRAIEFNVTSAGTSDRVDAFSFVIGGSPDPWQMWVYEGPFANSYNVTVDDRSVGGTDREVVNGTFVVVNVTDQTVTNATGTRSLASLNVDYSAGSNETAIENGDRVEGTYSITYGNPDGLDEFDLNQTASPRANVTIERLNTTFLYETDDIRYNTTVRIRPGGDDA